MSVYNLKILIIAAILASSIFTFFKFDNPLKEKLLSRQYPSNLKALTVQSANKCQYIPRSITTASPPGSSAMTWYVRKCPENTICIGSDGRTEKTAFRTIADAIENSPVREDDIVLISPDVYYEKLSFTGDEQGRPNTKNSVTYKSSVPGQYFVVDGSNHPTEPVGITLQQGVKGITFDGIEVRNWAGYGINMTVDHWVEPLWSIENITVRNCRIHHNANDPNVPGYGAGSVGTGGGLFAFLVSNLTIDYCKFHNNGPAQLAGTGPSHGAYLTGIKDSKVINNTFYNNGTINNGTGAKVYNASPRNVEVAYNIFARNYDYGFYTENGPSTLGNGTPLPAGDDILIHHNIFYKNRGDGFGAETTSRGIKLYNNTFYKNNEGIRIARNSETTSIDIKNNILYNDGVTITISPEGEIGSFDYNAYIESSEPTFSYREERTRDPSQVWGFKQWQRELGQDTHSLFLSHRQSGITSRARTIFGLKSNSPLIDAGVNVELSCVGRAPDIGAFEFLP